MNLFLHFSVISSGNKKTVKVRWCQEYVTVLRNVSLKCCWHEITEVDGVCCHCSELLWTLSDAELHTLETALCTTVDESEQPPTALLVNLSSGQDASKLLPDNSFLDDSSDTEQPSTSMVHSDSTMTVVAASKSYSSKSLDDDETNSSVIRLPDSEARLLQHSVSWPNDTQRDVTSSALVDSPAASSAMALCGRREFILSLPCNTSAERVSTNDQTTLSATSDSGIIYLSTGSGGLATSSGERRQQITFVTDELCRLFVGADISDDVEASQDGDERFNHNNEVITCQCGTSDDARTCATADAISEIANSDTALRANSQQVTHRMAKDACDSCLPVSTRTCVAKSAASSFHCRNLNNVAEVSKAKICRRSRKSGFPRSLLAQSWSGVDVTSLRTAAASVNTGLEIGWDPDR